MVSAIVASFENIQIHRDVCDCIFVFRNTLSFCGSYLSVIKILEPHTANNGPRRPGPLRLQQKSKYIHIYRTLRGPCSSMHPDLKKGTSGIPQSTHPEEGKIMYTLERKIYFLVCSHYKHYYKRYVIISLIPISSVGFYSDKYVFKPM